MGNLATDKVVLVTGGGGGIGAAVSTLFAEEGAAVVVVADADVEAAERVAASIVATGHGAIGTRIDVTDDASVAAVVDTVIERFGRLDAAVNNAGISGTMTPLADLSPADWAQMLAVNLTGVFLCLRHELRHMGGRGAGAVVNTSSGAGIVGVAGLAHYAAAKHGVLINAVCPGTTDTQMIRRFIGSDERAERLIGGSVGRGHMGAPAEVAEAIVWLCSDRASFVNGESMVVDGATVCR